MPIVSNFDREHGGVHAVAVGTLTFDDFKSHLSLERPLRNPSHSELIDARAAELVLTPEDLHRIAELLRGDAKQTQLGRTAVLVKTDSAFQLIRLLETMVEGVCELRPFRKEEKARLWLTAP